MKKIILPLTVVVLAAGMQLTSFDTKVSSEKHVASKRYLADIGAFNCSAGTCEAYGPSGTNTITSVVTPDGISHVAHGTYARSGGSDQGTLSVSFTDSNGNTVTFTGRYFV